MQAEPSLKYDSNPCSEIYVPSVLNAQTQVYWHISRIWNGQSTKTLTLQDAFFHINGCLGGLNPQRPLVTRFYELSHNLVHYGSKRRMPKASNQNDPNKVVTILR